MRRRATQLVQELVNDALSRIPQPYGEDVTRDVFVEIKRDPELERRYYRCVSELSRDVVNNWIGQYTRDATGMRSVRQVHIKEREKDDYLMGSYRKLAR
jgi:predicted Zn-dependent protease with MMP-like domain